MMGANLLALLLVLCPAARAASADPSLLPEFENRKRAPKPAAAPRRAVPADEPAPPPPAAADETPVPEAVRPPRLDRPDQRDEVVDLKRREWIVVRERTWLLSGTHETRFESPASAAAFTRLSGTGDVWDGETYNTRLRGAMPIAELEVAPFPWLSFVGEFGTSVMKSRGWADTAWIDSPRARVQSVATGFIFDGPGHAQTSHASAGVESARTTWESASVAVRLLENRGGTRGRMEYDHSIDLLIGAHQFKDEFTAANAIVDGYSGTVAQVYAVGTRFPGPDLHQRALWRGPHAGLRLDSEVPDGFGFHGLVLWSPLMEYRGDVDEIVHQSAGNLRPRNPTTLERAHGTAIHFRLGASWRWEFLSLEGGYMRLYFYSRSGRRRQYAPDGSSTDELLDHAITERSGFFVGASARF